MRLCSRLIFFIWAAFLVGASFSGIVYVDVNGNDSSGTGSEAAPFLSIPRAVLAAADGDTIALIGGSYIGNSLNPTLNSLSKSLTIQPRQSCFFLFTRYVCIWESVTVTLETNRQFQISNIQSGKTISMNDFTIRHTDTGGWPIPSPLPSPARVPALYVENAAVTLSSMVVNSSLTSPIRVTTSRFTMNSCRIWGGRSLMSSLAAGSSFWNNNFYFGGLSLDACDASVMSTNFWGIDYTAASWPQGVTTTQLTMSNSNIAGSNLNFYYASNLAVYISSGTFSCQTCLFSNGTYSRGGVVPINAPLYGVYVHATGGSVTLRNTIMYRIRETLLKDYLIKASGSNTDLIINTTILEPPSAQYAVFATDIASFRMLESSCSGGLYFGSIESQLLIISRSNFTNFASTSTFDGMFGVNPSTLVATVGSSAGIYNSLFSSNTNLNAIELRGAGQLTVSGTTFSSNARAIYAGVDTRLNVDSSIFFQNGPCDGAAITCVQCYLSVYSSQFFYHQGFFRGPIRVALSPATVSITTSSFTGNRADLVLGGSLLSPSGGAISVDSSTVAINSCSFTSNSVLYAGGAVSVSGYDRASVASISDCTFDTNGAANAGAIFAGEFAEISVARSTFRWNFAEYQGGAIFLKTWDRDVPSSADFLDGTVIDCTFESNYVGAALKKRISGDTELEIAAGGGAISVAGDWRNIRILSSRFESNKVIGRVRGRRSEGGAIQLLAFDEFQEIVLVEVSNCTFIGNEVSGMVALGGALSSWGNLKLFVGSSSFSFNRAISTERSLGGAAFIGGLSAAFTDALQISVASSSFDSNAAMVGGGLVVHDTVATLTGATFRNNSADHVAGGLVNMVSRLQSSIAFPSVTLRVSGSQFSQNLVTDPIGGTLRNVTCYERGIGGQPKVQMRCDACDFVSPSSSDNNWSPHFGAIMGEPFMLTSSATKDPFLYVRPNAGLPATGASTSPYFVGVSDLLDSIVINFPESMMVLASPGTCAQLLSAASMTQFFAAPECTWDTTYTQLAIKASVLPYPATIEFNSNSLLTRTRLAPVVSSVFTVLPPASPFVPIAEISALPAFIPPCSDVVLDATASFLPGSFSYLLQWALVNPPTEFVPIVNAVSSEQRPRLEIPFSAIPVVSQPVQLTFSFSASLPFFPSPIVSSVNVTIFPSSGPRVFMEGPLERFHPAAFELQLSARVEIPPCLDLLNSSITSQWTQIGGPSVPLGRTNGPSLFFAAKTFAATQVYRFRFSAFVTSSPALQGSVEVEVTALYGPMSIYPSGAGGLLWNDVPANLQITVVDLDNSPGPALVLWDLVQCPSAQPSTLLFDITRNIYRSERPICFYPGSMNCSNGAPSLVFGAQLNNALDVTSLPVGNYTIRVSVAKDGRTEETFVFLQLKAKPTDAVVRPLNLVIKPSFNAKPNPSERIAFTALVTNASFNRNTMAVVWEILGNSTIITPDNLLTPMDTLNIAFKPSVFSPGQHLVRVSLFDRSTSALLGQNRFLLDVNSAPVGNSFDVAPESLRMFDSFTLRAVAWADADAPLRYVFSVLVDLLDGSPPFEFPLADVRTLASLHVRMPVVGLAQSGNVITLRLRVQDLFGAETVVDRPITVLPANSSVLVDAMSLTNRLNDKFAVGDIRAAVGSVLTLVQQSRIVNGSVPLSTSSSIFSALNTFVSKVRLTSLNARFVVKIVQTLLIDDQRQQSRSAAADLLIQCISAVKQAFQTESTWLTFSNQHGSGRQELETITKGIIGVVEASRLNRPDLVSAVTDLLYVFSRTSVPGEFGLSSTGGVSMTAAILPASTLFSSSLSIDLSSVNVSISFNTTGSIGDVLGDRVGLETAVWSNSSFPSVLLNETGHDYSNNVTSATTIGGTVATITIRSSAEATLTANVIAVIPMTPPFSEIGNASFSGCAQFNPISQVWDASSCTVGPISGGVVTCSCSPQLSGITVGTPAAPSTTSQGVHIGLLFGVQFSEERERPDQPSAPSGASATGDVSNSVLGPAIGGAVAGAVLIAVAVGTSYYLYKKAQEKKARQQMSAALSKANSL